MSRPPVVHQYTAVLAERDALGNHTLAVDDELRALGAHTEILAGHVHRGVRDRGRDFRDHTSLAAPDLVIYQASTGSPVAEVVASTPAPLVLNYHNITPAAFFDPWEPAVAAELVQGRRQLARLCPRTEAAIAVSDYNGRELRALGCDDVHVVPVIFRPLGRDGATVAAFDGPTLLFVGRLAPNKRQQDLVMALAALDRRGITARLVLVGAASSPGYEAALADLAAELGVAERVVFAGSVTESELVAWYDAADVFVCASAHEGFCVPVVEALGLGVPVVAGAAAALPETIGDAGLLLADPTPSDLATAVERLTADRAATEALIGLGHERAAELAPARSRAALREVLAILLERMAP